MILKVIAKSAMEDVNIDDIEESLKNLSGFSANVCYSNGYDESSIDGRVANVEANIPRFDRVIGTGHHSISDHPMVTVYLGGISKMIAMILNSFGFYATSERSARYTDVSKNASEVESALYNEWKDILSNKIEEKYPFIDATRRTKLAMENARYFISVLNPSTSMVYTTSHRQWSYIAQWFKKFADENKYSEVYFLKKLSEEMIELHDAIIENKIGTYEIGDMKNRKIGFLARQTNHPILNSRESYGYNYHVKYDCSFACLAQAQRHRTLRYVMDFDPDNIKGVYIPDIIKDDEELSVRWVEDMSYVSDLVPQGLLVTVHEEGNISDLDLKCRERLCGRAQLEIAKLTARTVEHILENTDDDLVKHYLTSMYTDNGRIKAKCELLGICKEHCEFGPIEAVSRII